MALHRGRPRGVKRPKQIVIRLTEDEYNLVKNRIEKSGKSQQDFLISAITKSKIVNTEGNKELAKQLKPIGVNLNQVAKYLNEGNPISEKILEAILRIESELRNTWQSLNR